ncbi:MAG: ABC transporter ATP-binding protein [Pseudolysinimonas sp.]|uniref:ABC transporter ATP-binding protein n=1 Tax=Pseudolysinimonas sp. TaxID=2680009 RepID=UPI003C760DA8
MPTPILSVRDVHKTYGTGQNRFDALTGVSFEVPEGQSVAIVGKSGSGKSTLMHMLALLDAPTKGTIALEGADTRKLRGSRLNRTRNKTFGFVFQQFFLTPRASVLDNVILPLKIADKAGNRAVDLSGGQKQRAVIARALVNNPRIIFADEPTGNLDSVTGAIVEDILFGPGVHPRRPPGRRLDGGGGMKALDLVGSAVSNTFRSKTRTVLTDRGHPRDARWRRHQRGPRRRAARRPAGPHPDRLRPGVDRRDRADRDGHRIPRRNAARRPGGESRPGGVAALRVTRLRRGTGGGHFGGRLFRPRRSDRLRAALRDEV